MRFWYVFDVRNGLSGHSKSLLCIYFYDEDGSHLFEQICTLPEYYLTRAEEEILSTHASEIAALAPSPVQIVELGSGSSVKTRYLIEAFLATREGLTYRPVDISRKILTETADELHQAYPQLTVHPVVARYEQGLDDLSPEEGSTLLLWLGSSIGNLERGEAATFLADLRRGMSSDDQMLIGIDLIKSSEVLEAAYNDSAGVTAAFNLNLLARINRELGGDFDLEQFHHQAVYNTRKGRIEMYLESRCKQTVRIAAPDMTVYLDAGERIHTEDSYKYDLEDIADLAKAAGVRLVNQWFDSQRRFSLNLFAVNSDGT